MQGDKGLGETTENDHTIMKQAALFIGINDYQPPLKPLSCAREDAAALYQLFLQKYTSGLVHFLGDTNSDEIVNKLKYLMGELDSGDLLLVYFSGHGVEERNNHYLLSSQAERFGDEWRHALSVNVLKQITKKRGVQTVFIFDSCREHTYEGSRDVGGAAAARGITMKKLVETQEADFLPPVIFCSCSGGEMAFEVKSIQHGLFTLALIELLSNAKSATLEDITRNVSTEISKLIKKYRLKGRQTPEVIKNPLVNPVLWGKPEDASSSAEAPASQPVKEMQIKMQPSAEKPIYSAKDYKVRLQTVRDILAMQMYPPSEQQEKIKLLQEIHQLHDNGDHEQAYTLLETLHETCLEDRDIYKVTQLKKQIEDQLSELKEYLPPLFEIDYTIACGDFERRKYKQAQARMEILLNRDFPPARAKKAAVDKQIMQQQRKAEKDRAAEIRRAQRQEAWKNFCRKFKIFCIVLAVTIASCIPISTVIFFCYQIYQETKQEQQEEQQQELRRQQRIQKEREEREARKEREEREEREAREARKEREEREAREAREARERHYRSTPKHLVLSGNMIQAGAFEGNTNIESVTFDDTVTTIGSRAFRGCTNLRRVIFGRYVINVFSGAFAGCTKLDYVECKNYMTVFAPNAFYGCTNLRRIRRPPVPQVNTMDLYGQEAFF